MFVLTWCCWRGMMEPTKGRQPTQGRRAERMIHMFEKYNYRGWLEEEVLDKLGLEDLIPTDSLHIFIERGEVEGVYDGGKVRELRGVSAEEVAEMVEEHNLAWERATDTEKILIDRDELIDAIRDTIHKAAGFQRH